MSKAAPKHLRPTTRRWWLSVTRGWELDEHHLRLLTLAAEAWDTSDQARERIGQEGLTVLDRFGQIKAHPCAAIERDAKATFSRLLRELDLDVEPPADEKRPPQLRRFRDAS